jgi:hypothetical protein
MPTKSELSGGGNTIPSRQTSIKIPNYQYVDVWLRMLDEMW